MPSSRQETLDSLGGSRVARFLSPSHLPEQERAAPGWEGQRVGLGEEEELGGN